MDKAGRQFQQASNAGQNLLWLCSTCPLGMALGPLLMRLLKSVLVGLRSVAEGHQRPRLIGAILCRSFMLLTDAFRDPEELLAAGLEENASHGSRHCLDLLLCQSDGTELC